MRPGRKTVLLIAGLIFSITVYSPAFAKTAGYCLECHSKKFIHIFQHDFEHSNGDSQNVYQMKLDPCLGLRSLSEELFFTESRIVKLNQILGTLEQDGWNTDGLKKGVAESAVSFSDLKEHEKVSIEQFKKETSAIRTVLQKIYDRTLQSRGETNRRWLIGLGSLFFLGLLILIGLGYRKLDRLGRSLFVCFVIGGMFFLTACTPSPLEREKSPGQERLEQSLSLANQINRQTEETFYQSCLLAEMSREWSKMEPAGAERGFQLAWTLSMAAREKAGQIQPLKEIGLQWTDEAKASKEKVHFDTVLDLREELRDMEGRIWAPRVIAEEWAQVNPKAGRSALEVATKEALAIENPEVRNRELKSISEAWTGIDEIRSLEVCRAITDPFMKAVTLAHVSLSVNDKTRAGDLLREAWQIIETIPSSYAQSMAMIQVCVTAAKLFPQEKNVWMDRVLLRIQNLKPEQLKAFALQGLVFHWASLDIEQAKRLAMEIPPAYPEERAYALISLAKNKENSKAKALTLLKEVSAEMVKISDPFIAQKVKALIAKELAIIEPREALQILPKIEDSFHRSEILEALSLRISARDKMKALELAERIPLEPFRMRNAVAIIRQWIDQERERVNALHQEAFQAATTIADPYPQALILIELGKHWGRTDRGKELKLLDMALGSAEKISSPWMKAEIVETVAETMKNVDETKAQALIDRIEPSVFRIRKSLEEVRRWAPVDPEKAKQLAEAVPPNFVIEKAIAFGEAASGFKKGQPSLAFDLYWRAIKQVLMFPEGHKGRKLLRSLVVEAARLNKEGTLQRVLQISESDTRDILLKEAGSLWVDEDPSFALKAAREISEGSWRVVVYQKIADHEAKRLSRPGQPGTGHPFSLGFSHWGLGRERAKKDESQAVPHYEKAFQEIRKMNDLKERSYLLGALAAEWATADEERAVRIAEEISSEFSEPLSFSLLQIGIQLKKWNRKGAEALFQKAVSSAVQIRDQRLKGQRLFQIGRQWKGIDKEKGREVLITAENEARKSASSPEKGDPLLTEVLAARLGLDPDRFRAIFQRTDPPVLRAKVLLEQGKIETKEAVEENIKTLERAFQYAKKTKQPRLLREATLAWYALDPDRGIEMTSQIEVSKTRIKTLCEMARRSRPSKEQESKHLLERAIQEAILIPGLTERIKALKEIAETGMVVDREQAKTVYQLAYRMIENASF